MTEVYKENIMCPKDIKIEKYQKELEKHEIEAGLEVELIGFDKKNIQKERKKIESELKKGKKTIVDKNGNTQEIPLTPTEIEEYKQKLKKLEEKENNIIMDSDQMRVFLKDLNERLGGSSFKDFIEKYCKISLNTELSKQEQEERCVSLSASAGKLEIELNPLSFIEYGKTEYIDANGNKARLRYFNPAKAAFVIGKALGDILYEPDNWEDVKKIDFVKGSNRSEKWGDFVGFCIVNPDEAQRISPSGYRHFHNVLTEMIANPSKIKLPDKKKNWKNPIFDFDNEIKHECKKKGILGKIPGIHWLQKKLLEAVGSFDRLKIWLSKTKEALWRKSDWYEITVAEFEDKEAGRILVQNTSITERDKMLKHLINSEDSGDIFQLRTLLLADIKTGDFNRWRIHAFLQSCDSLYRKTNGNQITAQSYNFIMRLHRLSFAAKRFGTGVMEYTEVEPGHEYQDENNKTRIATSRIYVRKSEENLIKQTLDQIAGFTTREMGSGCSKDTFGYMKIGGKFIDIEDHYTLENDACPTGKMSEILGNNFWEEMCKNMTHNREIKKLDPDQIAVIARYIADQEAGEKSHIYKGCKTILNEHTRSIALAAYNNYLKIFNKPPYRQYVEYFLKIKRSELYDGGKEQEQMHDMAEIENFTKKELDKKEQSVFANGSEFANNISSGDVSILSDSPEKITQACQAVKNNENILNEKKITPAISKSKLSEENKKLFDKFIKKYYDQNEIYIKNLIYSDFEKQGINLTNDERIEIQRLLAETRPYRREITRYRNALKYLGLKPYIERVRSRGGFTDTETEKIHQLLLDQMEISAKSKQIGTSDEKIIKNIYQSLDAYKDKITKIYPNFDTQFTKAKNLEEIIKILNQIDKNLPRQIDIDSEKIKLINLEKECQAFAKAPKDEKDIHFSDRKERLKEIKLVPAEEKEFADAANDEQLLTIIKKVKIATMLEEGINFSANEKTTIKTTSKTTESLPEEEEEEEEEVIEEGD